MRSQKEFDATLASIASSQAKRDQFHKDECTLRVGKYVKGAEDWLKSGETYKAYSLLSYCEGRLEDPKATALYKRLDAALPDKAQAKAKVERAGKKKAGVSVGMTEQDALDSSWGKPQRVNTTRTAGSRHEQWVYRPGNYLYFENGILTAIQN